MKRPTWDILIPTIPHRHDKFVDLLEILKPQITPGVGVIAYLDNLQAQYGPKCQALGEASNAEYVSWLSDDDKPRDDFVEKIRAALDERPDYVGYKVRFTEDGVPQRPVIHSLRYKGWDDQPDAYYRDIVHFNPMRRELALQATFRGNDISDREWADDLRAVGCVKTEVFIDDEILHYKHTLADFILTQRRPMEDPPARPEYPFLRYI
jgi:hypothetical protein